MHIKSGCFIYYQNLDLNKLSGIDKKVASQINVLNKHKLTCDLIIYDRVVKSKLRQFFYYFYYRRPNGNCMPKWYVKPELLAYDFIYLRRPACINKPFIKFLRNIKKANPNIKTIMEIPTYPYDKELWKGIKSIPIIIKEMYNRRYLYKYIDRIAIQNHEEEIFRIPTVNFYNGIDFNEVHAKNISNDDALINICAVASLEYWDGYERVFKGLYTYINKNKNCIFHIHIVGEGSEKKYYEQIVEKYNLTEYVTFYGKQYGEKLNEIYDKCELALDVFGMYKKNNDVATSLKSREYLAKGLPIITGCKVDVLHEGFKYYLEFDNDDSIIDFYRIELFYRKIYRSIISKKEIVNEIRNYGIKVCDIDNSMNDIIKYILDKD